MTDKNFQILGLPGQKIRPAGQAEAGFSYATVYDRCVRECLGVVFDSLYMYGGVYGLFTLSEKTARNNVNNYLSL